MNAQLGDLAIAYGVSALGMLAGLLIMRADARAYWRWPVYSAMVMALAVLSWNLLFRRVLPLEWVLQHPGAMFYCALSLYAVFGVGVGLLLGRLTGRKTSPSSREEST